ncbi:MAG: acetate--CoA ligase family protein, partial [Candidatus Desulfacyla sp.]
GGTGVEIYKDTTLRMAPIRQKDVASMLGSLKAHRLLEGYRGAEPINLEELTRNLMAFSALIMDLGESVTSIDLNPVFCSPERCVAADARIMLE